MKTKFIFITGGVVSSLGKGIIGSSIGQLLKRQGYKVVMQKFDPYINVYPGLLSPMQHGEVFVTDDGTETDLDIGHYERFLGVNLSKASTVTSGQIYLDVINKEKQGYYSGQTVQVIPHITENIKLKLEEVAKSTNADIVITEIGGTVGDIESLPFLEAIRQVRNDFGYNNTLYLHTTLVPYIKAAKEIKTKPTQHSVRQLMNLGIYPNMLVIRSERHLNKHIKEKVATLTGIPSSRIFESVDLKIVYEMILRLKKQQTDRKILEHFKLSYKENIDLEDWQQLITKIKGAKEKLKIMIVGNYVFYKDAYLSVHEALKHAGYHLNKSIEFVNYNPSKSLDESVYEQLLKVDGIVVPGGYGKEGIENKIKVIEIARTRRIPFLGICLGMQLTALEIARNVLGIKDATSKEFNEDIKDAVIDYVKLPEKDNFIVGRHSVKLHNDSMIRQIYKKEIIQERFRHHYELNKKYIKLMEQAGYLIAGYNQETGSANVIEYKDHPFFIAVQFHPEFLSRPLKAHPLFLSFIEKIINIKDS